MPMLTMTATSGFHRFDKAECARAGEIQAAAYQNAEPFPHAVLENFLDKPLLRRIANAYPLLDGQRYFDRDSERLKYQFQPPAIEDGLILNLLAELNSEAFLAFLESMTGIKGLIPDPYYAGGGLHLTRPGGHLGVHADFNVHDIMMLERRLNLLVYLNDDWDDKWGGQLELWDKDMKSCQVRVLPELGRAVVFSTTLTSFHGHPDPLRCPPTRDRRSIATYYYTAFTSGLEDVQGRNTQFRARPNTSDRRDWRVDFDHWISDWTPPRLQRYARRMNPFPRR